jgi:hypothetical protein
MAYEAMFATISPFLVIYDNTTKANINLQELTELESLTLAWMLTIILTPPRSICMISMKIPHVRLTKVDHKLMRLT